MEEKKYHVVFYKLKGASHGYNGFRSIKAYDLVDAFIREKLGL